VNEDQIVGTTLKSLVARLLEAANRALSAAAVQQLYLMGK
jgi:hypothetical protein